MPDEVKLKIGDVKSKNLIFSVVESDIDEENKEATVVVSDESIDRAGDIVKISAWEGGGLDNYKKHPVLLSSHSRNDLRKQIGKCVKVWTENGKMFARFKWFVGDGNEEADWGWKLISKYKVAAFSISFIIKMMEELNEAMIKAGIWSVISKAEMTEISQVTVPCNANALSLSMKSLDKEKNKFEFDVADSVYKKIEAEKHPLPSGSYALENKNLNNEIQKAVFDGITKAFEVVLEKFKSFSDNSKKISELEISVKQLSEKTEVILDEFCKSESKEEPVIKTDSEKVLKELESIKNLFKK